MTKSTTKSSKKVASKKAASETNGNELAPEPEPSATYEILVDRPATFGPLLRDCWNDVREGDALFDDCAPEFQATLLAHALAVLKTSAVLRGDTHMARFENEVGKRKNKGQVKLVS